MTRMPLGYERCRCCNRWIDRPNEGDFTCMSCTEIVCKECAGGLSGDDVLRECPWCVAENAKDAEVARLMQESHARAMNAILGVLK